MLTKGPVLVILNASRMQSLVTGHSLRLELHKGRLIVDSDWGSQMVVFWTLLLYLSLNPV